MPSPSIVLGRRREILLSLVFSALFGLLVIGGGCRSSVGGPGGSVDAARTAYDHGDFAGAQRQAEEVVAVSPDDLEARRVLALALAAQGMNEAAIEQYVYIIEREPDDHAALYQVAMLERVIGRVDDAIGHLEAAVALKADPSYMDDLARTYVQVGRYKEAADLWGRVLEDTELDEASRVELLKLQASAFEDARLYEEAKAALDRALLLAPNDKDLKERIDALE